MRIRKKVNLTDIFLFIAAGVIDLYQEIKDPFNLFSNYYQSLYGQIPARWKKDNLRALFLYCIKKKYLKKESEIKTGKFLITQKGIDQLRKKYPHFYYKPSNWDKKIRLVIFDIQELNRYKRNQLRKILKQLGFIMLQKSVWVSPYNQFKYLKTWIKDNKIEENILLIETEKINIKNKNSFLEKFWRSDLINLKKT